MTDKNCRAIAYDSLSMSDADSKHLPEAFFHLMKTEPNFFKLFGPETSKTILAKDQVIHPVRRSRRGGMAKVKEYAPGVSGMSEGLRRAFRSSIHPSFRHTWTIT